MCGKKQSLKPDTILKNYWSDNEQFADLFKQCCSIGMELPHCIGC